MQKKCRHCGTPFRVSASLKDFCCHGCEQVSHLIESEGLDAFYQMQDQVGRPLKDLPESILETNWARDLQRKAESAGDQVPKLILRVEGMTCMGCVWLVERLVGKTRGVQSAKVSLINSSLSISWQAGEFDLATLVNRLVRYGYRLESSYLLGFSFSDMARRSLLCASFTVNVFLLELSILLADERFELGGLFRLMSLLFVGLSWLVAGGAFVPQVIRGLRARVLPHDLFLLIGSLFALIGYLALWQMEKGWFNLSSFSFLAMLIVSVRWIHTRSTTALDASNQGDDVAEAGVMRRRLIGNCALFIGVLALLAVPVLIISGQTLLSVCAAVSGMLMILPTHLLYELARYERSGSALATAFLLVGLGLTFILLGALSPIGAILFGACAGLLSVAVLGFSQKLRTS